VAVLVVNALALTARWDVPFETKDTGPRDFRDAAGTVQQVPTMHRRLPRNGAWAAPDGATVVELRCAAGRSDRTGARVRFVLGAPETSPAETLAAAWSADRRRLDADEVIVALPRLALTTTLDLAAHFAPLGLRRTVRPGADLGGLADGPLFVDKVRQQCVLKVTEVGVEAASVTDVMTTRSIRTAPRTVLRVAFDRPFGIAVLAADGDTPLFTAWQSTAPRDPGTGG
jgi:serpin B